MLDEPNNASRAAWAENAVNTFAVETYGGRSFTATVKEQPGEGDDAYTMIQDLICDLMHLAHRNGWNAAEIVRKANDHFDYEIDEEATLAQAGGE